MISEAIGERRGNWLDAFKGGNIIWGGGLGAFGHKVLEYSKVVIADGNYFKMIAEVGIIGTFIFIAIVIRSLIAGFKDFRNKYLEIGIVMGLAIQAIGSNILTYQIIVPIFWYAVGRLANKKSIIANEND
jgi:riboflavin transporter FmnP